MASASTPAAAHTAPPEHVTAPPQSKWRKFVVPVLVLLLAAALMFTITRNWNSWEGGRVEQVTGDASVRGGPTRRASHGGRVRARRFDPAEHESARCRSQREGF